MYRFSTYKRQYKANLKLALPVVMTQLGQILVPVSYTHLTLPTNREV